VIGTLSNYFFTIQTIWTTSSLCFTKSPLSLPQPCKWSGLSLVSTLVVQGIPSSYLHRDVRSASVSCSLPLAPLVPTGIRGKPVCNVFRLNWGPHCSFYISKNLRREAGIHFEDTNLLLRLLISEISISGSTICVFKTVNRCAIIGLCGTV